MLVYIYACEDSYQGLHGMYEEDVVEVRDLDEAEEIARDMAMDVIESYDILDEDDEVEPELIWRIYRVGDDFSENEVRAELGNYDEEEFVEHFCVAQLV